MLRFAVVIALVAGLALPAAAKPKVTSDATPGVDFAAYQTFAFVNASPPAGMNPVAYERIRMGVENGLSGKGYTKGDPGDLSVLISVGAQDRTDIETWGAFGRQLDVRQYTEGQLSVDVFDTKTQRPVWHGQANDTVNAKKLQPDKVEATVQDVMARFPSRGTSGN